eukprot:TRINITY_DN2523_c1_g1_i1.p1 TRINITY_DN2523_c1_g1~~TRINITY_DN2523_c1_g1_i1.p1  ORF type:complete len:679 (+),score=115.39 TRINITY_DN2523_c1_g1_i1:99-2135(+)
MADHGAFAPPPPAAHSLAGGSGCRMATAFTPAAGVTAAAPVDCSPHSLSSGSGNASAPARPGSPGALPHVGSSGSFGAAGSAANGVPNGSGARAASAAAAADPPAAGSCSAGTRAGPAAAGCDLAAAPFREIPLGSCSPLRQRVYCHQCAEHRAAAADGPHTAPRCGYCGSDCVQIETLEHAETVILDMGFSLHDARQALRQAGGDTARAVLQLTAQREADLPPPPLANGAGGAAAGSYGGAGCAAGGSSYGCGGGSSSAGSSSRPPPGAQRAGGPCNGPPAGYALSSAVRLRPDDDIEYATSERGWRRGKIVSANADGTYDVRSIEPRAPRLSGWSAAHVRLPGAPFPTGTHFCYSCTKRVEVEPDGPCGELRCVVCHGEFLEQRAGPQCAQQFGSECRLSTSTPPPRGRSSDGARSHLLGTSPDSADRRRRRRGPAPMASDCFGGNRGRHLKRLPRACRHFARRSGSRLAVCSLVLFLLAAAVLVWRVLVDVPEQRDANGARPQQWNWLAAAPMVMASALLGVVAGWRTSLRWAQAFLVCLSLSAFLFFCLTVALALRADRQKKRCRPHYGSDCDLSWWPVLAALGCLVPFIVVGSLHIHNHFRRNWRHTVVYLSDSDAECGPAPHNFSPAVTPTGRARAVTAESPAAAAAAAAAPASLPPYCDGPAAAAGPAAGY